MRHLTRVAEKKQAYSIVQRWQKIPYNLYIAVSYIKQTLTLEFSSKILKEKYPDLITKDTIKECLANINQLNICNIDIDSILSNGAITSADVTYDANLILMIIFWTLLIHK